jgi:hypothetical protein
MVTAELAVFFTSNGGVVAVGGDGWVYRGAGREAWALTLLGDPFGEHPDGAVPPL